MNNDLFITYTDENGKIQAFQEHSKALAKTQVINHSNSVKSIGSSMFENVGPGRISIRDNMTRPDYDRYRPDDVIPTEDKDIINSCMEAARHIGIVKNTIELMVDLAIQGVDVVHPVPSHQRFMKRWWNEIVHGPDRCERIASLTLRAGTAVVKRHMATVDVEVADELKKVGGADDFKVKPNRIPWRYTILNPLSLEVINEELRDLMDVGDRQYGLRLTDTMIAALKYNKNINDSFYSGMPKDLLNSINRALRNNKRLLPLNNNEISVVSYKKDDWQLWADPFHFAILDDLRTLQKMKLADLCALDGAIAQIRLWKLGDLEHKILPKPEAFARLAQILMNAVAGGIADIMWGPAIELIETGADLHNFLGEAKYVPTLKSIFFGLGLPTILTGYGNTGQTGGISELKVFMQRLRYIRQILTDFWAKEFKIIQMAMGFTHPAQLVFDSSVLDNEAGMLNILMAAVDRNLVSEEVLQERLNTIPEIERVRIRREHRDRVKRRNPPKAGPFNNPESDDIFRKELLKTLVDTGRVDPINILEQMLDTDVDELPVKPQSEAVDLKAITDQKRKDLQGTPVGRPRQSRDKQKRKPKVAASSNVVQFVQNLLWAENVQKDIAGVVTPFFLKLKAKENVRQLTEDEFEQFETMKFAILCNLKSKANFDIATFKEMVKTRIELPDEAKQLYENCVLNYRTEHGSEPGIDKLRNIKSKVVALLNYEDANLVGSTL